MINNLEYLKQNLKHIGVELNDDSLITMLEFMTMVIETNKSLNLTSITDEKKFINLHIVDSLTVFDIIPDYSKVIDVGTGAGFPGMILKIANPTLDITLLDSTQKRLDFIDAAIEKLKLERIVTVNGRAEELSKKNEFRESFDICVSRAVAKLPLLCEYCIPFIKADGSFIAMKGSGAADEIKLAGELPIEMGCENYHIKEVELPDGDGLRNILCYKKNRNTPNTYPRKNSVLKKLYK